MKKTILLILLFIITSIFFVLYFKDIKPLEYYYEIIDSSNKGYTVVLYDKDKNVLEELQSQSEPIIVELPNGIIEVIISVGSPANYTLFYDVKNKKVSPSYFNLILYDNGKVVYMENGRLIISDPFDKNVFYKEIVRDFSPTAVPSSAIGKVYFLESGELFIEYLEGKDFNKKTEKINLLQ